MRQMGLSVAFARAGVRESGRVRGVTLDGALRVARDRGGDVELYSETVEVLA
jgi:hypothetical protein